MESSNVMEVCRLCLDKERVTIPIFEGEGVERDICFKIGSCLPVKVSSDDPLPKKICDDCTDKVELVYSFWNTTANAEKQLLEWLGLNEPHHQMPMDLLKTEMDDATGGLSQMDVADESHDAVEQTGDVGVGNEGDSGREEDPGGGGPADGTSNNPCSKDNTLQDSLETAAGPSGVQQPSQSLPKPQETPKQQAIPDPLPVLESPRYVGPNQNGGKRDALSKTEKEVCNICGKRYVASFMIIHKRNHTGEQKLDCPFCGTTFPSNKSLRSHMVSHSDSRPFSCELCDRKFKRNNELNMHMKIHSGEKAYQCDLCEYSCVQKSNLTIHRKRHINEFRFMCDICDKGCYTTQELQKHKMTHMDITYKCKICSKQFNHKYGLTMHEKKHDPNYEPPVGQYKCEPCGKSYVKYSGLKVHMRKHTGVRPYTCEVCGKSVSSRAILEVHQRTHTGEKPHICEMCGKMFTSKRYLDAHIRTHTGERPFTCNECGKSFSQHSTLIVHSRYHSGKRPHQCPVCGKGFVLRCQMRSHQKSANHFPAEADGDESSRKSDEGVTADESTLGEVDVADVADADIIIASAQDPDSIVITCYDDLELTDKILYSCSKCNSNFADKGRFLAHQKKSCKFSDPVIKSEPSSESE